MFPFSKWYVLDKWIVKIYSERERERERFLGIKIKKYWDFFYVFICTSSNSSNFLKWCASILVVFRYFLAYITCTIDFTCTYTINIGHTAIIRVAHRIPCYKMPAIWIAPILVIWSIDNQFFIYRNVYLKSKLNWFVQYFFRGLSIMKNLWKIQNFNFIKFSKIAIKKNLFYLLHFGMRYIYTFLLD